MLKRIMVDTEIKIPTEPSYISIGLSIDAIINTDEVSYLEIVEREGVNVKTSKSKLYTFLRITMKDGKVFYTRSVDFEDFI